MKVSIPALVSLLAISSTATGQTSQPAAIVFDSAFVDCVSKPSLDWFMQFDETDDSIKMTFGFLYDAYRKLLRPFDMQALPGDMFNGISISLPKGAVRTWSYGILSTPLADVGAANVNSGPSYKNLYVRTLAIVMDPKRKKVLVHIQLKRESSITEYLSELNCHK
jgi:hypothetical protein